MYNLYLSYIISTKGEFVFLNLINIFLCKLNILKNNIIIVLVIYLLYNYNKLIVNYIVLVTIQLSILSYHECNILNNFYLGYYKIHPPLLYLSLILCTIYFQKKNLIKCIKINIISLMIITFILGSLWALSQFIWGKYWSYDSIEFILLLFIILYYLIIHKLKHKNPYYGVLVFCKTLFLLILLRLNLIFTKHNFFQQIVSSYIYLIYIYLFIFNHYLYNQLNLKKLYITSNPYSLLFLWILLLSLNLSYFFKLKLLITWLFINYLIYSILLIKILIKLFLFHILVLVTLVIFNNYTALYFNWNFLYYHRHFHQINLFFEKKNFFTFFWKKKKLSLNFRYNILYTDIKDKELYSFSHKWYSFMINYF